MSFSIRNLAVLIAVLVLAGCNFGNTTDDQAQIRLLNASQDYNSLDLYVDGTREAAAVAYGKASGYIGFDAGTYTVAFAANGSASKLQSASKTLAKKAHKTYVGYGSTGAFSSLQIDEDQDKPSSGNAKLLVLNAATDAGAVDVYLTTASTELANASPVFSSVSVGTAATAGYVTVSSGTYRLRVVAAGSTTDVRLDVSSFNLASEQVAALVVADTTGGVLVNAMLLSQQDSLTMIANPNARLRAAVGIANGTAVTVQAVDTTLVSNGQAKTIGAYQQIAAGSDAIDLSVDGSAVTVANQTLTAGNDYTLLVWSNSGGTQVSLINDDNRLPLSDSGVKVRLLNAMSGLAAPISLAVDFYPVAEDVAVGQASSFTELTSSTDSELDISNADTSAALFAQTGTSLLAQGVYTMFMFGDVSETTGRLRKER